MGEHGQYLHMLIVKPNGEKTQLVGLMQVLRWADTASREVLHDELHDLERKDFCIV